MSTKPPVVSVFMTTYFHEAYINQAIESVLWQKTTFPYEIVISDDASTDKTQAILKEYSDKYDNIRVNINDHNLGLTANMYLVKSLCKGKYICDLSGDDYWIDEYKLQKQYEFLEKNPDYYSVCTRVEIRPDFSDDCICVVPEEAAAGKDFTLEMFVAGNDFPMNGIMMKNPFLNEEDRAFFSIMPKMSKYIDDLTDNILLLMKGNTYILEDCTVAYRVRNEIKGDRNFNSINKQLSSYRKHIELLNNLYDHFQGQIDLFIRYRIVTVDGLRNAIQCKRVKEYFEIFKTIPSEYKKRGLLWDIILTAIKRVLKKVIRK